MTGVVITLAATGRVRANSSEDVTSDAIIPYAGGEVEHSKLPSWYTDRVETSPRQVFLLVAVLFCLLTAFAKKQRNREEQLLSQVFGALALVILAIVDMIDPFRAAIIVMVSGFLASFVIVACLENSTKMHIVILSILVLPPILIATLANKMETGARIALLLSPIAWIVYKSTVRAIRGGLLEESVPAKRLLAISAAIVLLSAVAVVISPCSSTLWIGGFTSAIAGCIVFNAYLIIHRWKNRNPIAGSSKVHEMTRQCLGLMIASMIVCNILIYESFYYKFPSVVLIPTISLIWSYFVFVYLHDHIRGVTHNSNYFVCIGLTFLLMVHEASFLHLSSIENADQTDIEKLASAAKQTRSGFVALTSGMMFVYFMMTLLVQTDDEPDTDYSDSRDEAQEMAPAAAVAPSATVTRRPAAPNHSTVPVAVVIDRPCAERTCETATSYGAPSTAVVTQRAPCSASSSSSSREESRREQTSAHATLLQPD